MPTFGKPSPEELETLNRRRNSTLDLGAYYEHLDAVGLGDWGYMEPDAGESQRLIKRRLTTAAKERGLKLRYKKTEGDRVYFRVNPPEAPARTGRKRG